jgi:hypothetical protein
VVAGCCCPRAMWAVVAAFAPVSLIAGLGCLVQVLCKPIVPLRPQLANADAPASDLGSAPPKVSRCGFSGDACSATADG